MKITIKGIIVILCFAIASVTASLPIWPSVGRATDPETNIAYDSFSEEKQEESRHGGIGGTGESEFTSQDHQEISNRGNVILPSSNLEEEENNLVGYSENQDPELHPGIETNNPEIVETENTYEESDLNGVDAILLSYLNMVMNQSRNEASPAYERNGTVDNDNTNCTDISCLFPAERLAMSSTDQYEDRTTEENEEISISTSENAVKNGIIETTTSLVPTTQHKTSDMPSNARLNLTDGDQERKLEISQDGDNEEIDITDKTFKFSLLPGYKSFTVPENNINTFEEDGSHWICGKNCSRTFIPGKNITREIWDMEMPDIVPFLKKCGVFPACRIRITAPDDVVNLDAEAYKLTFSKVITNQPDYMEAVMQITCDPTNVSITVAFAITLAVIIVVSNIVIIAVTLRTKSLRKPHGYFKISLAIADFLNGAFVLTNISSNMIHYIHFDKNDNDQVMQLRRNEPDYSVASFFGVVAVLSQVATVYSVLLLSVDSFLSIRWPMQYRVGDLMTSKRAWALIVAVWAFALAVSSLPLLADEYVKYGLSYSTFSFFPILEPIHQMSYEDAFMASYIHVILYAALVWGIPFLATWLMTLMTAYHSRGMLKQMNSVRKKTPAITNKIGRLERDILRTVLIVLIMLTITVLPMIVCLIIISLTTHNNLLCIEQNIINFLFASYYILICGSFLNVIVYNACNKDFRRATFQFLCDILGVLFACVCPKRWEISHQFSSRRGRATPSSRRTTSSNLSSKSNNCAKNGIQNRTQDAKHKLQMHSNYITAKGDNGTSPYYIGNCYGRGIELSESGSDSNRTLSSAQSTSSQDRSISSESSSSFMIIKQKPSSKTSDIPMKDTSSTTS